MFALIGRLHINGKNKRNCWSELELFLRMEIKPIEQTKAIVKIENPEDRYKIEQRLDKYNIRNHTDFFVE